MGAKTKRPQRFAAVPEHSRGSGTRDQLEDQQAPDHLMGQ